jgi:hypothetical protein
MRASKVPVTKPQSSNRQKFFMERDLQMQWKKRQQREPVTGGNNAGILGRTLVRWVCSLGA